MELVNSLTVGKPHDFVGKPHRSAVNEKSIHRVVHRFIHKTAENRSGCDSIRHKPETDVIPEETSVNPTVILEGTE